MPQQIQILVGGFFVNKRPSERIRLFSTLHFCTLANTCYDLSFYTTDNKIVAKRAKIRLYSNLELFLVCFPCAPFLVFRIAELQGSDKLNRKLKRQIENL